jgi:signal transduction histidine kinase
MIGRRFRSLQIRLAVRLAAVYVVATAIAVGILVYQAYDTAGALDNRDLSLRAADLARYVVSGPAGTTQLELPSKLSASYEAAAGTDIFAIRGPGGKVIAALPAGFGKLVEGWPPATDEPSYFHISDIGAGPQDFYGLNIAVDSAGGPLSITVARAKGTEALVDSLLREFVLDIAWVIPLIALGTMAIGVLAIRSGLKPIRAVSDLAKTIGPSTTSVRLPADDLPNEIIPLVAAVNDGLDHLERGFATQRRFTANAAHELRTPLAIITAALDAMEGNGELVKVKSDVARMNRLVEQLLRVARLDAITLDVSGTVDLNEIAAGVVATMAPWALAQERTVAFDSPGPPIAVVGNAYAVEDALRNLVENAVTYSPAGTEVTVSPRPDGSVSVADRGPGIPLEHRESIFDRFWRGKGNRSSGAGLGLAIVKEIMKAHGGRVVVDDNPDGGTIFTLHFRPAAVSRSKDEIHVSASGA